MRVFPPTLLDAPLLPFPRVVARIQRSIKAWIYIIREALHFPSSLLPFLLPVLPPFPLTYLLPGLESNVPPGVPPPVVMIGIIARRFRRKHQTGWHGGKQHILGTHARPHTHAWVSPRTTHPSSPPGSSKAGGGGGTHRRGRGGVDLNDLGRPFSIRDIGGSIVVRHVPAVVATVYCVLGESVVGEGI
jgi:hypothetical protein